MFDRKLLLRMLPGLIPLLVFIIADEVWGTRIGLYVAVGVGLAELIFTLVRTRKLDRFILLDTSLIVILGAVSLLLENDIFFKIKPALIEAILAGILGLSAFGKKNLVLGMTQRYMKGIELSNEQNRAMQRSIRIFFWITVFHIALVLYSAWFLSEAAWGFISGVLYYVLFAAWFGIEFLLRWLKNRRNRAVEWLPVVDEEGRVLGKAPRDLCHFREEKLLHPVVHLHLFNTRGELYLQHRPMHKKVQPGKWDTAVGGHLAFGETVETALRREAAEELGLNGELSARLLEKYIWESEVERELVFMFRGTATAEPRPDSHELAGGKFWPLNEIRRSLGKGIFTPNFELEFRKMYP
ncbi:MAG: NUDIX domain-containing protein [Bacteroidota bacterium]